MIKRIIACSKEVGYETATMTAVMAPGGEYKIFLLRVEKDGIYKAFFHVPLFVGLQVVVRSFFLFCRCISRQRKKNTKKIIPGHSC